MKGAGALPDQAGGCEPPDLTNEDGVTGETQVAVAMTGGTGGLHISGLDGTTGRYNVHFRRCRIVAGAVGTPVSDELRSTDCRGEFDQQTVFVTFDATAGQTVRIDVTSSWDNDIAVWAPDGTLRGQDFDSGPGLDARLEGTLQVDGIHIVEVESFFNETGPFTITITELDPAPAAAAPRAYRKGHRRRP